MWAEQAHHNPATNWGFRRRLEARDLCFFEDDNMQQPMGRPA